MDQKKNHEEIVPPPPPPREDNAIIHSIVTEVIEPEVSLTEVAEVLLT